MADRSSSPWLEKKWVDPLQLSEKVKEIRTAKKTIATLNGSFDLLHAGHLYIVQQAKLQADVLIVALNSDQSIQSYKGKNRPIVPLEYRLSLMAALEFVTFVTSFEETDPRTLLEIIAPDVHVNGIEYGENCIEAGVVRKNGGRLHLVDRIDTLSTSQLIERIKQGFSLCV
jgi:rfaE bifunctional protein nucleotidyltransferase chain/domain